MKRSRNTVLVVSAVLIVALVLLFTDPRDMIRKENREILLQDPSAVERILLADHHDSTELIRKGRSWYLFGEEPANRVAVENLLFAAARLSVRSTVPRELLPDDAAGRQITFSGKRGAILEYTIYYTEDRTILQPAGSGQLYQVSLPGYPDLDLHKVFSSASGHYREKVLIELMPSEICLIEVDRRGSEIYRFTQDSAGELQCFLPALDSLVPVSLLDERSIRLLFSYFTSIRYEKEAGIPAERLPGWERAGVRMATLRVRSFKGEEHTLQVFPYLEEPGGKPHMFLALVASDRYRDALVMNYIYLDVLMRGLSHYFASGE